MQPVATAKIDHLSLTVHEHHPISTVLRDLLGYDIDYFTRAKASKLKWYKAAHNLYTARGDALVTVATGPIGDYNRHNLIQIHGLALSDSAWNALRPVSVPDLLATAQHYAASVTEVHYALDVLADVVPFDLILEQSLRHRYKQYIRSPFLRATKGIETVPYVRKDQNRVYYGKTNDNGEPIRSVCAVAAYNKRLSPLQGIYSDDNPLKQPWYRIESKLRGDTARAQGKALLNFDGMAAVLNFGDPSIPADLTLEQYIVSQISRYISFVEPTSKRASRCRQQQWWADLLASVLPPGLPELKPEMFGSE